MEMNVNRELIKKLRIQKSWSQEKLAENAGVSLRTVQRVETDGVASLQSRAAIAQALEVEPAALDVEENEVLPREGHEKSKVPLLFSTIERLIEDILRLSCIVIASLIGTILILMAVLKPFLPSKVGLFTSETTLSFGIVGNTANMQEHLGYWVIPAAFVVGLLLIKCVIVLSGSRART